MENIEPPKPLSILNLEKLFGITLENSENGERNYTLNSDKEVISLNLSSSSITNLEPLITLKSLKKLNIINTSVNDFSILSKVEDLEELSIAENNLTNIEFLRHCKKLKHLMISSNKIDDFSAITHLSKLRILFISDTKLKDLSFIGNLRNINSIFAIWNQVEDISYLSEIEPININLHENLIKIIPKAVAEKYSWFKRDNEAVILGGLNTNPLEFPPYSVIEQGPEVVQSYYEDSEQHDHKALSEGRIIFIGDGASGKSSIIEKILFGTFTKGREQTNGIKIEHFHLLHPVDSRKLNFHIWDFGGQEIQHAVHKFFFTEGCLYVLVLDNRKEEDPEYWLQQIESLGGKAPVLVVFNKQDENNVETVDRKYLKEKYPNIVNFYNTSCLNGLGMTDLKHAMEIEAVKLRTVAEQFPNNWLKIKTAIEAQTQGNNHYLTFEIYQQICQENGIVNEQTQKLLLRYFNTIGAVTWFGDDVHLNVLHVLKPEWITQGVYKIITSKTTADLKGQIKVSNFKDLLKPITTEDYTYKTDHYGFLLSMMKKFDLCYTNNDKDLLIPSAFGKTPKVEYSDFSGNEVRTYYLQFTYYMPLALIHRLIRRKLEYVVDSNYWYTGIVIKDPTTDAHTMIHADKEAKRIYIKIKGKEYLGVWEYLRRELEDIISNYAKLTYDEMIVIDDNSKESSVKYNDVVAYLKAGKTDFFHTGLGRDFKVRELIGLFEVKEQTIEKFKNGTIALDDRRPDNDKEVVQLVFQILNNNQPYINTTISNEVNVDIKISFVNETSNELQGDLNYLLDIIDEQNKATIDTLKDLMEFAKDAQEAKTSGDVAKKGWKRKLKGAVEGFTNAAETIKKVKEGGETFVAIAKGIKGLAEHFGIHNVQDLLP